MLKNIKIIFLIFMVSFLIKLVALFYTNGFEREPIEDASSYHNHAMAVYYGQGYGDNGARPDKELIETSSRPPALPYMLAGVYKILEPDPWIGRVFLILIGSLATSMVFILSLEIFRHKNIALLSSSIFLFYPPANFFSIFLLTEMLAALFTLVSVYFFFIAMRKNKPIHFFIFGVTSGLLVLTRSQYLLLLPFLLFSAYFFSYFFKIENKASLKNLLLSFMALIITLTPWTIRNYEIHDTLMPTTSRLGYMIYLSNHDLDDPEIIKGGYSRSVFLDGDYVNSFKESEKSAVYIREVIQELEENPLKVIRPLIMRTVNHLSFRPNPYKESYTNTDLIMFCIWIPILVLFFLSLRQFKYDRNWILFAVIFYNISVCLPFWGTPRLRFPMDPLFIICACFTILSLKSFINKKRLIQRG